MEVERLIVKLMADASQYTQEIARAERITISFATRAMDRISSLAQPFTAAAQGARTLGEAMYWLGSQSVKNAAAFEVQTAALEVMTGSAARAAGLIKEIQGLAVATPFKTTELLGGAQSLKSFGVQVDDIIPTLRSLGDVASGTTTHGSLDQKLQRIILAYGQVRVAGRLMGPELRQFIDAGIPMIETLAEVMDKPVTSIKTMVEEAKVGFPDVVRAFNKMTQSGGLFAGMNDRISATLQGRWSALVETVQIASIKIGSAISDGLGLPALLNGTQRLVTSFANVAEGMKPFIAGLREVGEFIYGITIGIIDLVKNNEEMLASVGKGVAIFVGLTAAIWATKIALAALSLIFGIFGGMLLVLKSGLVAIAVVLGGMLLIAIGSSIGAFALLKDVFKGIVEVAGEVVWAIQQMAGDSTGGWFAFKEGKVYIDQFAASFASMTERLGAMFTDMWGGVANAVKGGDLKLAFEIITTGIKILWHELMRFMTEQWVRFQYAITDSIFGSGDSASEFGAGLSRRFANSWYGMEKAMSGSPAQTSEIESRHRQALIKIEDQLKSERGTRASMVEREVIEKTKDNTKAMESLTYTMQQLNRQASNQASQSKAVASTLPQADQEVLKAIHTGMTYPGGSPEDALMGGMFGAVASAKRKEALESGDAQGWRNWLGAGGLFKQMTPEEHNVRQYGIPVPIVTSTEAVDFAARTIRELGKGQWAGKDLDAYGLLMREQGFIEELVKGPPMARAAMGAFGVPGVVGNKNIQTGAGLTEDQAMFARFHSFENFRRKVGTRSETVLPPLALKGSTEAQESINRAQTGYRSVQEEVRDTILQGIRIEEAQLKRMEAIDEEMKKLNSGAPKVVGGEMGPKNQ